MAEVFHFDKSRLVNENNLPYLKGLFYETTLADKSTVSFTLKKHDHEGYPSLYRLYMEEGDITEYRFWKKYFVSLEHWERLSNSEWFQEYIQSWRKELEMKLRSEALAAIQREAKSSSKNAFYANRFLLEGAWKQGPEAETKKRGRTSKEEIKKEAMKLFTNGNVISDDYKRLVG